MWSKVNLKPLENHRKCIIINLKCSFCYQVFQIFVKGLQLKPSSNYWNWWSRINLNPSENYGNCFIINLKCSFCYQGIQVYLVFFFLVHHLNFYEEFENRIIMSLWNDLHKLSIIFFWIHKNFFDLKHENWPGEGSLNKENFIWKRENGQVTSSRPLWFLINIDKK